MQTLSAYINGRFQHMTSFKLEICAGVSCQTHKQKRLFSDYFNSITFCCGVYVRDRAQLT